ncbi:MAG: PhnD/SsuA/transferrin family substrate-binding protein [Cyanobacteria bacterium P01_F01_bin.153]
MKRRQFIQNALGFAAGSGLVAACGDRGGSSSGNGPEVLRFSVTDVAGLEPLEEDFGAFYNALGEVISLPVEPIPLDSFVAAAPALLDKQMDLVLAGPSEYLLLRARAQATPVVAITRPGYRTKVMVLAGSDIQSLKDLKGKVVGMRAEGSTAGHIGTSQMIADAGLDPVKDITVAMPGDYGLEALLSGEIDAWADSLSRVNRFVGAMDGAISKVTTLVEGPPLPNDVFVARSDLDSGFLETLENTMVSEQERLIAALAESPENLKYADSQLVSAQDKDYDQIRAMYQTLGLGTLIQ